MRVRKYLCVNEPLAVLSQVPAAHEAACGISAGGISAPSRRVVSLVSCPLPLHNTRGPLP